MPKTVRMRVSLTFEYDANPEDYTAGAPDGKATPEFMAALDKENFDDLHVFLDVLEGKDYQLEVTPA